MRTRLFALIAVAILGVGSPNRASAQVLGRPEFVGANQLAITPAFSFPVPSYGAPRVIANGTYFPVYDYYGAPYPLPARIYAGYGSNDFAFHGQAYGHAYEPWTWAGLSRYPARPVSRFLGP